MHASTSHARAISKACAWLVASCAALVALSGCISVDLLGGGEGAPLEETVVRGRAGPKILLLDVSGVIGETLPGGSLFGMDELGTAARVAEVLDRARGDDEVAAVLLRIDSPGGTATESEQVYDEIRRFKAERGIPVAAQFLGTATSGAYYVAMAADVIQAHPTTVTGSIGVLFTSLSFAGLMEKLGVEDQTLTGGLYKDAGSPFRRLTDVEREQLQTIVDDLHARFREIVARGRPKLTPEQIKTLASGQVYSARQALELGLVDGIGTVDEAVRGLEGRLGLRESRVVAYHRPREVRRNLYTRGGGVPRLAGGLAGAAGPAGGAPGSGGAFAVDGGAADAALQGLALQRLDRLFGRPGFHYVWWPGVGLSSH